MEQQLDLFEDDLHCEVCNRPLPANSKGTICTFCAEQMLFSEVKDYIRENDVTEYDVAVHFDIPIQQVKRWIREGRIEYKTKEPSTIRMQILKLQILPLLLSFLPYQNSYYNF